MIDEDIQCGHIKIAFRRKASVANNACVLMDEDIQCGHNNIAFRRNMVYSMRLIYSWTSLFSMVISKFHAFRGKSGILIDEGIQCNHTKNAFIRKATSSILIEEVIR